MENKVSLLIEALVRKGWCFRDVEELKGLIQIHIATVCGMASADTVESELLLNMDLRSFGGKSLPDDPVFKKSSHLQGLKVLQIVSVRDILQSSIEASSRSSRSKRLLRLGLTDGYSEVVAIEYSQIPSIDDDIVPGTKVRLENKVAIQSGILCLSPKVITVLGGVVQTLHEEWEMSRKYSGFSRSSLRLAQKNGIDGPPPFEKLQIGARPPQFAQHRNYSYPMESTLITQAPTVVKSSGNSDSRETGRIQILNPKQEQTHPDMRTTSATRKTEEKPSSSESRPKEAIEAVPVQNQAAAQKLLQKMNQPTQDNRRFRGPGHRGKGKEEEAVFTLDEWEGRKGGGKPPPTTNEFHDISRDEEMARQLQNQLDLEHYQEPTGQTSEAERIRMNMFNFGREEEDRNQGRMGFRGRGRGRGWGRGRGRGRGGR